jgi:ribonuclease T2
VTPDEVEEAFVAANPGLTRAGIAVGCDRRRLTEVRICLNRDLHFRDCAEVDRRACRRDKLIMPPLRGADNAGSKAARDGASTAPAATP